ncbi:MULTISPECIES: hypothetical protein [Lysinibacillus]|uniref:J domain-containing protein n=1 Tax=Lysinibacillus capsici TaxID=2115968 RepID=A0ABY8KKA6_9BACI|nr:hypothetical protein [Lysinibacillus capsici]WGF39923.1 hypothetical protein QBO96_06555 [Lysinibacillus capsici]
MDIQKILAVESLEELKELGKMREIRSTLQEKLGDRLKIRARGWEHLFTAIQQLSGFISVELAKQSENVTNMSLVVHEQKFDSSVPYFKTEADQIIYALLELQGKQRQEKLHITKFCYNNAQYAKKWRNDLAKIIHPDKTAHPKAEEAIQALQELYEGMVER